MFLARVATSALFFAFSVMDYILSVTGSGAKVVRDAMSQRFWPGLGSTSGQIPLSNFDASHDGGGSSSSSSSVHFGRGQCDTVINSCLKNKEEEDYWSGCRV